MNEQNIPARVKLTFMEGTFEVAGTERFVEAQIKLFSDTIRKVLEGFTPDFGLTDIPDSNPTTSPALLVSSESEPEADLSEVVETVEPPDYSRVYHIGDGQISFSLKKAPGTSPAKKIQNLTLLYLLARSWNHEWQVPIQEVRDEVKKLVKLDAKSYLTALKNNKDWFVIQKQTVGLSEQGLEVANDLLADLLK
jgi:hypothetical protein